MSPSRRTSSTTSSRGQKFTLTVAEVKTIARWVFTTLRGTLHPAANTSRIYNSTSVPDFFLNLERGFIHLRTDEMRCSCPPHVPQHKDRPAEPGDNHTCPLMICSCLAVLCFVSLWRNRTYLLLACRMLSHCIVRNSLLERSIIVSSVHETTSVYC